MHDKFKDNRMTVGPMDTRWVIIPVCLCLLDIFMTLCGQPDRYWSGEYCEVSEASPVFARYLAIHPNVFVFAGLIWVGIFVAIIRILPKWWGKTVSLAITLGHGVGSAGWLVRIALGAFGFAKAATEESTTPGAYFGVILLLVLMAVGYVATISPPSQNGRGVAKATLNSGTRWIILTSLAVIPFWWFVLACCFPV